MPIYEYYCAKCATKFEELRPVSRADEPATCPEGHPRASRTLSVFAAVARDANGGVTTMGGGCACGGGGCGCAH